MGTPNWPRLVEYGLAKTIGIAWNKEELKAIHEYKIPVEYVRAGFLTIKEYEEQLIKEKNSQKELETMTKDELLEVALENKIDISSKEDVLRSDLIIEVEKKKRGRPKKINNV